MKATVTKAFDGVENEAIYPRTFQVGEVISGRLADVAIAQKWALELKPDPSPPAGPLVIPEGWADLKAADQVKLARDLGAPAKVNTKAEAASFIQAELERRAAAPPAV